MAIGKKYRARYGKEMWGFDEYIGPPGRRRRVRPYEFETKDEAENVLAALRLDARQDKYGLEKAQKPIAIATLMKAIEKDRPKDAYRHLMLYVLALFSKANPGISLQALDTIHVKEFIQVLRALGLMDSTINHYLGVLGSALHSACDLFATLKHWKTPKITKLPGANRRRERIYSPEDVAKILSILRASHPESQFDPAFLSLVADIFELALLTVRRQGELLHLRKADVNLSLELLRVNATKTRETFFIKISPRVREILARRASLIEKGSQFLFCGKDGPKRSNCTRIRRALIFACEIAGIPYGRATPDGVVYHDTRHTAMTAMLQAGHDISTAQSLSRHSSATMALRYAHATAASQKAAAASLENFVQSVPIIPHESPLEHAAHARDDDDKVAVNQ